MQIEVGTEAVIQAIPKSSSIILPNCVTAIEIHGKETADGPQLPPLVKATATGFKIEEVSADKAYATIENYEAIDAVGATLYIAFK